MVNDYYIEVIRWGKQLPFIKSHLLMMCCVYVVCKDAKLLADGGRKINKSSINYVTWSAWVNWLKCFFVCLVHNSDRIQENNPS